MVNQINRTGIEGFDFTWNPVIGCLCGCPYCWARQCVRRFAVGLATSEMHWQGYRTFPLTIYNAVINRLKDFSPTFLESQFAKSFPKKPARIVVGWMSDIAYWQPDWMERVLGKIKEYPQHTFFFLTKNPTVYTDNYRLKTFPENCWLGQTISVKPGEYGEKGYFEDKIWELHRNKLFASVEPILGEVKVSTFLNWIIIGAQTGNGNRVIPKREWVEAIINQAKEAKVPVYIKDNLSKIYPEFKGIKEIPE